jgi:hypothetical protein
MTLSRRLLRENPHIAAWHFYSQTQLFRDSRILNRCQRHHCSTAYCMRVNKKKTEQARERGETELEPECRFLFPHQHRETAEVIRHPGKTW